MQWQWLKPLKKLADIVSGLLLMVTSEARSHAALKPTCQPFSALLTVTPAVAAINTPRLLTITAYFPLGCGPTGATAATITENGTKLLDVCLNRPAPELAICDLVLVPYTVEMTYTPLEAGNMPLRMVTSDGVLVGSFVIMTRGAGSDQAHFDVTGNWINPATRETGLALVADSARSAAVIGTWDFFDHEGVSRRYSIEGVHWNEPDVEAEGAIFETTGGGASTPSAELINLSQVSSSQLGMARITFNGRDCARIFALGFGGNVLFTSNLVRSTF